MLNILYIARTAKGWSIRETAKALGVSIELYSRWERIEATPKLKKFIPTKHHNNICKLLKINKKEFQEWHQNIVKNLFQC